MINFIKEQLAVWKLKRSLHKYIRPDRAFLQSARTRFITLAQQSRFGQNAHSDAKSRILDSDKAESRRAGVTVRAKHPRSWKYATIAIVAVLSMTSGMAVFADASNVPVTHPLYSLKRLSEQIRLGLSTPEQQVELHQIFAQRRLEEASELETNHDDRPITPESQTRINGLDNDFQKETEHGLDKTQDPQVHAAARAKFCQDILDIIQQDAPTNPLPSPMVDHIKTRCADAVKTPGN